ncbi:hypothetical protein FGM00_02130 [Aggregatimonas sangjinii]|uniref:DUF2306 domain-containing protein n=1 Tax=Aggregatimonas sangjinii TaxID=2583587 RepID=A0A5B7SLP0_9FLAO|nr:DUF2306 domain-containing protein [Aggregatimonas sangjinii]QCW98971.1 hypothetical protein FGM00_02130 [Aggregatimonas sangjinii]
MLFTTVGIVHLSASIVALLSGSLVLRNPKGTNLHKKIGYVYSVTMSILLVTAFMIYRLHGSFGILHWFAVISSLTLLAGIVPILLKRPNNYMGLHLSFMYWSVIGLYCAFFAEILTRLPFFFDFGHDITVIFYMLVGVATAIVGGLGSIFFRKYKEKWIALGESFEK